ncbi:hypothetical protein DXG01_010205 [Tephrocybe rancida]|nr:hypothetical protein DXG01_010205 [Tephrocybe rancida]
MKAQTAIGSIAGTSDGRTTWLLNDQHGITAKLVSGLGFATATITASGGLITERACSITLGLALCATSTASESAIAVETPVPALVQIHTEEGQIASATAPIYTLPSLQPGVSQTSGNPAAQTSDISNSAIGTTSYLMAKQNSLFLPIIFSVFLRFMM